MQFSQEFHFIIPIKYNVHEREYIWYTEHLDK
jgi:hypothetical protein